MGNFFRWKSSLYPVLGCVWHVVIFPISCNIDHCCVVSRHLFPAAAKVIGHQVEYVQHLTQFLDLYAFSMVSLPADTAAVSKRRGSPVWAASALNSSNSSSQRYVNLCLSSGTDPPLSFLPGYSQSRSRPSNPHFRRNDTACSIKT